MLEQLLLAEQAHKQALFKLEDEKRNHGEFMKKSDEFTNLLEQERERSEKTHTPMKKASMWLNCANFSSNHYSDVIVAVTHVATGQKLKQVWVEEKLCCRETLLTWTGY